MEEEYVEEEQSKDVGDESDDCEQKLKKVKKELQASEKERKEYLEGWQRARADFQNYIKQKEKEMEEFRRFANADFISSVLPILDNFSLAASSIPEDLRDNSWTKGIVNTKRQFEEMLREYGMERMDVKRGDAFDPSSHESIEEVESDAEAGTIAEVVQDGYALNGRVLRAARVKLAK